MACQLGFQEQAARNWTSGISYSTCRIGLWAIYSIHKPSRWSPQCNSGSASATAASSAAIRNWSASIRHIFIPRAKPKDSGCGQWSHPHAASGKAPHCMTGVAPRNQFLAYPERSQVEDAASWGGRWRGSKWHVVNSAPRTFQNAAPLLSAVEVSGSHVAARRLIHQYLLSCTYSALGLPF